MNNAKEGDRLIPLAIPFNPEVEKKDRFVNTAKAVGVHANGETIWFPKSQIQNVVTSEDEVKFDCPQWLVEAKGVDIFIAE